MGFLNDLFGGGDAGKATKQAADSNRGLLSDLKTENMGYIGQGLSAGTGYLNQAQDLYKPLSDLGTKGANLYADALGVNGSAGNANAQGAFQAGPGYQFAMDQGQQALERSAAARGSLQSGQTGIDTMKFGQGLANQEYGNWLSNLSGYNNLALSGAQGQAGTLGALAGLSTNAAGQRVGVATDINNGLMGANNQNAAGQEQHVAAKQQGLNSLLSLGGSVLGGGLGGVGGGTTGVLQGIGKGLTGYGGF